MLKIDIYIRITQGMVGGAMNNIKKFKQIYVHVVPKLKQGIG